MQQTINNGESGLSVRTKLNDMFTEIYSSLMIPIKISGAAANVNQAIPANTFVNDLSLSKVSGTPLIRIGTTANGEEIVPDTTVDNFNQALVQSYYAGTTTWYLTISGGVLNVRINVINNYY